MSIPRIARIHLVYQFIILTLIIFAISYIEILPDKRFLFLALIPVFSYQLIIIFCCTELLPLPYWLSWVETANVNHNNQELPSNNTVSESPEAIKSEESKSCKHFTISPIIPRAHLHPKQKDSPESTKSSDANTQTVYQNVSDIFKKTSAPSKASARRSESTKSYVFKHKKYNVDLEDKENLSPYQQRNWRFLKDQKSVKSQSSLTSPTPSLESKEVMSPEKLNTLDESIESDSSELTRSLSFPFRQKKRSETGDIVNDFNIQVMPAWNALDYFSPSNTSNKRRKSISTEAIDRELRLINSHFEHNAKNDFTRSMEVEKDPILKPVVSKRGVLKPSASFNKWKQGVSNYFNKPKRENIEVEDTKEDSKFKKPFYKELFITKDFFCQDDTKKKNVSKMRSSPYPKFQNSTSSESRSPTYISYDDHF